MRVVWLTDIHLDFVQEPDRRVFYRQISEQAPDALLIGGDIGEADKVCEYLKEMEHYLQRHIFFVLGNHDYYRSSISEVRDAVSELARGSKWLRYLPDVGVVRLTDRTALIGHGGWADGRFGTYMRSEMLLNDYFLIKDFNPLMESGACETNEAPNDAFVMGHHAKLLRLQKLKELGDQAAESIARDLYQALSVYDEVVLLTHVPPFREACWYQGDISDDNALPHFASKAVGDVILQKAENYPTKKIRVLCGHTHSEGRARISGDIEVLTGSAEYGRPEVQAVLDIT